MNFLDRITEFKNITVTPEEFSERRITGKIRIDRDAGSLEFHIIFSYSDDINADRNLAGLVLTMPVINFTLFSKKLTLDFPASDRDVAAIREFVRINNREVFINKLVRRRYEFYLKEFLPSDNDITAENSNGMTEIVAEIPHEDSQSVYRGESPAVLSSGGKESLLSYGMLREIDENTHAFYFNESGFHWLTAKTAHEYYAKKFSNVHKVWSNVDRFYRFVLRNMHIMDQRIVNSKTDTYPVQLFIFPVYVMAMVPLAIKHRISGAVLGDEFDDPREMPSYRGIRHYYGVYDQTHDFNGFMTDYLHGKGMDFTVWSAVYPVTGSVVENILIHRYPDLFALQRSCHSCRNINGKIVPCGKCSKCLGILMFVLAAGGDPEKIEYSPESVISLKENVDKERMRLDSDELNLMKQKLGFSSGDITADLSHVSGIHVLPDEREIFEKVPNSFRRSLISIISEYAPQIYILKDNQWVLSSQKNID